MNVMTNKFHALGWFLRSADPQPNGTAHISFLRSAHPLNLDVAFVVHVIHGSRRHLRRVVMCHVP